MTTSTTVRLGDLDFDPIAFEGQDKRLEQLDDLLASIPASGLAQSLLVRPWTGKARKGITHGVIAGRRRLATLRRCRDEGIEIQGERITDDWPVPVIVRDDLGDVEAYELSVVENVQRRDMSPGQEALAFAKMAQVSSIADVAAHHGRTEKYVRQRIRLAGLHPDLIALLDKGELSIAAAEAFTVEPDQARQLKAWKKLPQWDRQRPESIRQALTETIVKAASPVAKIIGAKAYKAAGGQVFEDEFTGESYWISSELIDGLLEAHWKAQVDKWTEEGWLFVEPFEQFSKKDQYGYRPGLHYFQQLKAGKGGFTAKQKGAAGVVYFPDGRDKPHLGMVRRGTKLNNDGSAVKKTKASATPPAELTNPGPSTASRLNDTMTAALQQKVAADPDLSLKVIVATLHARRISSGYVYYSPPVRISSDGVTKLEHKALEGHPMGKTFASAIAWAAGQGRDALLVALAELVGPAIDLRGVYGMPDADKRALIDLVDPDVSGFDPEAYFAGLTKPLIAAAAREFDALSQFGGEGKKDDLVRAAKALQHGTGWLPPQLRSATYTGPGGPPAPVVDERATEVNDPLADEFEDDDDFNGDGEEHLEAAE